MRAEWLVARELDQEQKIIQFLRESEGKVISYKKVAEEIGVSRVVVSTKMKGLQQRGVIAVRKTKNGFLARVLDGSC